MSYRHAFEVLNEQYKNTVREYEEIVKNLKQEDDGSTRRILELERYWTNAQNQVHLIIAKYNELDIAGQQTVADYELKMENLAKHIKDLATKLANTQSHLLTVQPGLDYRDIAHQA